MQSCRETDKQARRAFLEGVASHAPATPWKDLVGVLPVRLPVRDTPARLPVDPSRVWAPRTALVPVHDHVVLRLPPRVLLRLNFRRPGCLHTIGLLEAAGTASRALAFDLLLLAWILMRMRAAPAQREGLAPVARVTAARVTGPDDSCLPWSYRSRDLVPLPRSPVENVPLEPALAGQQAARDLDSLLGRLAPVRVTIVQGRSYDHAWAEIADILSRLDVSRAHARPRIDWACAVPSEVGREIAATSISQTAARYGVSRPVLRAFCHQHGLASESVLSGAGRATGKPGRGD